MKSVLSATIRNSISGGNLFLASSITFLTSFIVAMALASGVSCSAKIGASLVLIKPTVDKSFAPVSIRAKSPKRKMLPSGLVFTMILANSSGVLNLPFTCVGYSNCWSGSEGSLPMEPEGDCMFCVLTALDTSSIDTPRADILSGLSQIRMAKSGPYSPTEPIPLTRLISSIRLILV